MYPLAGFSPSGLHQPGGEACLQLQGGWEVLPSPGPVSSIEWKSGAAGDLRQALPPQGTCDGWPVRAGGRGRGRNPLDQDPMPVPLQGSYHWGSGWQETPLHGTAKIPGRVCCRGEEERIAKELGDLWEWGFSNPGIRFARDWGWIRIRTKSPPPPPPNQASKHQVISSPAEGWKVEGVKQDHC